MACRSVETGQRFLATALEHVDCQAQTIGSYGYGALADPGSPVALALSGLLTVFIAIFGVRLLLGYPIGGRDVVNDVLKIGIVLTLATSWPAWRIMGYDLVISGPAQIGQAIGLASGLPGGNGDLASRLQRVDEGLAALNVFGSGRLGVAQGDWFQLGLARSAFLIGVLGPLTLVRLTAGILLALAPLMAGLLLFGITRSVFVGWAKGLAMTFLASLALTLVLGAELALIEPWLQDTLARRAADEQVLSAPVEIEVITLSFALVAFGTVAVFSWIAFNSSRFPLPNAERARAPRHREERVHTEVVVESDTTARSREIAYSIGESVRRGERFLAPGPGPALSVPSPSADASMTTGSGSEASQALGSSYRRNTRRVSAAGKRRDQA